MSSAAQQSMGFGAKCLCAGIRLYRVTLCPLLGGRCQFYPSCSAYGLEAIRHHGAWRGAAMTFLRLCRCHPLHRGGFDPVPLPKR